MQQRDAWCQRSPFFETKAGLWGNARNSRAEAGVRLEHRPGASFFMGTGAPVQHPVSFFKNQDWSSGRGQDNGDSQL